MTTELNTESNKVDFSTLEKEVQEYYLRQISEPFHCFEEILDHINETRDFVMKALESNWRLLEDVSDEFKNDEEVVMVAMKQNKCAFKYAGSELQKKAIPH